ncbi:2,3,4,5-tetrahydropyridine-2,6-dicarboxylate N-succinyltransferase [Rickettsia endosymbiont of Cardiosporidium cionae]|uniref:2,3,4,5-tetrahydropyridine-2,6-dicarboxylate N-succinyltransferase n=1 Tax=Rickettsia endosymbiont of Cardiosporidium cionae TaxID=2777155 RepID=UPI001894FCA4
MQEYKDFIEKLWQQNCEKQLLPQTAITIAQSKLDFIINQLNIGNIKVCYKENNSWYVNEWVKKAILLYMKYSDNKIYEVGNIRWFDKINNKFTEYNEKDFITNQHRIVPGAFVRKGSYIGKNTVIMPSFINIGAHIGNNTLIDTWATVGSCAYVGENCHISGGTGIGGVLEPVQSLPVIIEDGCFIGARSEIVEGTIVEHGSVISMGVFIGASTKIIHRDTGKISYGKIPAYSVVVPGCIANENKNLPALYCAVITKQVDANTRKKISINELLRY